MAHAERRGVRWQTECDTAFGIGRVRAKAPSPLSTLRSAATEDGRSALRLRRVWRTRTTGEWFSLSSFGGEGWGEEAHHPSRCGGSWRHASRLPHQYIWRAE